MYPVLHPVLSRLLRRRTFSVNNGKVSGQYKYITHSLTHNEASDRQPCPNSNSPSQPKTTSITGPRVILLENALNMCISAYSNKVLSSRATYKFSEILPWCAFYGFLIYLNTFKFKRIISAGTWLTKSSRNRSSRSPTKNSPDAHTRKKWVANCHINCNLPCKFLEFHYNLNKIPSIGVSTMEYQWMIILLQLLVNL